jgi:hypothetical protein
MTGLAGVFARRIPIFALFFAITCGTGVAAQPQRVNADAQIQQDFQKRVQAYMDLHNRMLKQAPPLKKTDDPAEIKAATKSLADAIRGARANAKPGEIFTPETAQLFRRLMYPEVAGPGGKETKNRIKDEGPAAIPLKVNAEYPEKAALPTVPPKLLASLPQLPKDLEYRIVGHDLILRDVHANLIVDFIPHAIQ